jgi:hypothetical protein
MKRALKALALCVGIIIAVVFVTIITLHDPSRVASDDPTSKITVQMAPMKPSNGHIPRGLWGTWVIGRELPASTIACIDEAQAKRITGTELEYGDEIFRWKDIVTNHPAAEMALITAQQFRRQDSGSDSQVSFQQLGINQTEVPEVTVKHLDSDVIDGTTEVPGDVALVKDRDTIIVSVCNVYFEAKREIPVGNQNDTRSPEIDYSKPLFTRHGAILCPPESFMDVREGHSLQDLAEMFADPNNRGIRALSQNCEEWQQGVRLDLPDADQRSLFLEAAQAYGVRSLFERPEWVVVEDLRSSQLQWLVTRADEVTNNPPEK